MVMGCYGLGISRVDRPRSSRSTTTTRASCGRRRWRRTRCTSIALPGKGDTAAEVVAAADRLYDDLQAAGVEVLYDDRDASPGVKFADADLLGMPTRGHRRGEGTRPRDRRAARPPHGRADRGSRRRCRRRAGGPQLIRPVTQPGTQGGATWGASCSGRTVDDLERGARPPAPARGGRALRSRRGRAPLDALVGRASSAWCCSSRTRRTSSPTSCTCRGDLHGVRPGLAVVAGVLFTYACCSRSASSRTCSRSTCSVTT